MKQIKIISWLLSFHNMLLFTTFFNNVTFNALELVEMFGHVSQKHSYTATTGI